MKTTPAGARFYGEVVEPWSDANGRVILPKGTPVGGIVDASHRRGHFKGVFDSGAAADFADAEWNAVSAGDARPDADEEGQGQAVGCVYRRRQRAGHADRRASLRAGPGC